MKITLVLNIIALSLLLTGCEALDKMGDSIKLFEMPKISPKNAAISEDKVDSAQSLGGLESIGGERCPKVKVVPDLSRITQFSEIGKAVPEKMVTDTKIDKLSSTCSVAQGSVSAEIVLDFSGILGAAGVKTLNEQSSYTYPYFISVISPEGKILSKDVFALSMIYENQQIVFHRQDKLRQVIPLGSGQDAAKFQIMIGFQLNEDELAYNRSPKE